jgi:ComF family protein
MPRKQPLDDPEAQNVPLTGTLTGLRAFFQTVATSTFDLVFPFACAGCGRVESAWCATCEAALVAVPMRVRTAAMPDDLPGKIAVTGVHQGKLQDAIHALKYEHVPALAVSLGARLVAALDSLPWTPQVIVPVPLHHARLAERGYNQSALLAAEVATVYGLPCLPDAVRRERNTRAQVGLTRDERRVNVMNAFTADSTQVSGKIVLIVDDVLTTGATLSACAVAVLDAGAVGVYGLTVSSARD